MKINKITPGFVIQQWDTLTQKWTMQEFVASDECDYENAETNEPVDYPDINPDGGEPYLPFDMVQPTI